MAKGLFDWTAIHYAAEAGQEDICRLLLESRPPIDINARTKDGMTPFLLAVKNGHLSVARLLAEQKADLTATNKFGETAFNLAKALKTTEVTDFLFKYNPALHYIKPTCRSKHRACTSKSTSFKQILHRSNSLGTASEKVLDGSPSPQFPASFSPISHSKPLQYQPIAHLGSGAFAQVFLSKDVNSGHFFALKVMKKDMIYGHDLLKYAKAERTVLMSVSHPFLCEMVDYLQTPSRLILVLQYYSGGTLRGRLDACKKFAEDVAKMYAAEIFLAIEFLHRNEIAYRDLKLENILLDAEGHVRLVDFGLAKLGMTDEDYSSSFCGTPCYLAPEMTSQKKHNKMVDWYMFGCFIYEMVTGRPPFFAVEMEELNRLTETGEVQFPDTMSKHAKSLISALMRKNEKERLGAGRLGRKAIQAHPFFEGVDWKSVYEKQLPVPMADVKAIQTEEIRRGEVFGHLKDEMKCQHVFGW